MTNTSKSVNMSHRPWAYDPKRITFLLQEWPEVEKQWRLIHSPKPLHDFLAVPPGFSHPFPRYNHTYIASRFTKFIY